MNGSERLQSFPYEFLAGPLSEEKIKQGPDVGNCRSAVQAFYLRLHDVYLGEEHLVLPEALNHGTVVKESQPGVDDFFAGLQPGDIVYADKLRDSRGKKFSLHKQMSLTEDERMKKFHLGVYIGIPTDEMIARIPTDTPINQEAPAIWHASYIAGGTALWTTNKFCFYYQPVLARRLSIEG